MQSSRVGPHNLQIIQKGLQTKLQVDEIKKGLNCNHKTISPKFFYDEKGSHYLIKFVERKKPIIKREQSNVF